MRLLKLINEWFGAKIAFLSPTTQTVYLAEYLGIILANSMSFRQKVNEKKNLQTFQQSGKL